ncbi:MAG: type II toxin-antitoxin system VapB family antitoxin [Candidatus Acidiferrales bacterium]
MRIHIDLDDRLVQQAIRSSRSRTKRAAIEAGLRLLIRTHGQTSIRRLRGKVQWNEEPSSSRLGRLPE